MCEIQVLDDTPKYAKLDPRQYTAPPTAWSPLTVGYLRPVGDWNFQEVTVKGSKIKVELNGTVILDTDLSTVKDFMANSAHPGKDRTSGFFGLAGHNDPSSSATFRSSHCIDPSECFPRLYPSGPAHDSYPVVIVGWARRQSQESSLERALPLAPRSGPPDYFDQCRTLR